MTRQCIAIPANEHLRHLWHNLFIPLALRKNAELYMPGRWKGPLRKPQCTFSMCTMLNGASKSTFSTVARVYLCWNVQQCLTMFYLCWNVEVGLAVTWEHQPGDHLRQAFKHQCSINKSPTLRASTKATFFMEVAGSVETPLGQSTSCSWQGLSCLGFPRGRCGLIQSATKKKHISPGCGAASQVFD